MIELLFKTIFFLNGENTEIDVKTGRFNEVLRGDKFWWAASSLGGNFELPPKFKQLMNQQFRRQLEVTA